jgi:hypothetical protein
MALFSKAFLSLFDSLSCACFFLSIMPMASYISP